MTALSRQLHICIINMAELMAAILQRIGDVIDRNHLPHILYEDEDNDKVILVLDSDLQAAADHARSASWRGLKLHLDYSGNPVRRKGSNSGGLEYAQASAYSTVAAGAAIVAGSGILAFLKRAGN